MRNKCYIVFLAIIVACIICGCANKASASNVNTARLDYELSKYEENSDKILSVCTNEFIGNHAVDESFMAWFISRYGEEPLQRIVDDKEFNDSNKWYEYTGKSIHVLWYEYTMATGIEAYDKQFTFVVDSKNRENVVFDFAGDLSMADEVATTNYMLGQEHGLVDCFSDELLEETNNSDVFILNNEFSYTTRGEPIVEKYYYFRGDPQRAAELKRIGVDSVSLANNHVYDYREQGILDTFSALDNNKIPYVGAGKNLDRASQPLYYIANGKKIAIVSATQIEKNQNFTKEATEDEPGVLKCKDPAIFIEEIKQAKANSDYVLCIVHWGIEYKPNYAKDQVQLAEQFVEAGADAIIGGHTHCLEGVDMIDDVPIYYSLGNYWFAVSADMPGNYDTGLARVTINRDGKLNASFIPCKFSEGVTSLVTDEDEKNNILDDMNKVSRNAKIDSNGNIVNKLF